MEQIGKEIEKILKAGLGAVAAGVEKTQEAVEYLAEKGEPIYAQAKSAVCDAAGKIKKAVDESGIADVFSCPPRVERVVEEMQEMTAEEYRVAYTNHQSRVNRNKGGIARWAEVQEEPNLNMQSHTVRIGDVAFATIRFETYIDFMHRLQARSPFLQTFVIQLAGTEGGNYLATHRGAEAKGYSASMFYNMVSADGGQQWVENQLAIMNEMKAEDEK